jgi:hypothetical protein
MQKKLNEAVEYIKELWEQERWNNLKLLERIGRSLKIDLNLIESLTLKTVGKLDKYDKAELLREHAEDKQRRNRKWT